MRAAGANADENPVRVSVIGMVAVIMVQHQNGNSNAPVALMRLERGYLEVTANCSDFKI